MENDSITVVDWIMLRTLLLSVMKKSLINAEIWLSVIFRWTALAELGHITDELQITVKYSF